MNITEANKKLNKGIDLRNHAAFKVRADEGEQLVCLDGDFTIDELRFILEAMKESGDNAATNN